MRTSISPDLFSSLRLRNGASSLSNALLRKGTEVATGLRSDPLRGAGGDAWRLHAVESAISRASGYESAASLASGRLEATQNALGVVEGAARQDAVDLLAAVGREDQASAETIAASARSAFAAAVSALNTSQAGRSLFAGAGTDGPALASADDILAGAMAAVSGATTAADAIAALEQHFLAPGGGFEVSAYLGETTDAASVEIAEGDRIAFTTRADDTATRKALLGLAISVAVAENAFTGSDADRMTLLEEGARRSLSGADAVAKLRASVGVAQERVETTSARTTGAREALELERIGMVSKDQSEAATEFEALHTQLQAMQAVTARISGLSLVDYLR